MSLRKETMEGPYILSVSQLGHEGARNALVKAEEDGQSWSKNSFHMMGEKFRSLQTGKEVIGKEICQ